MISYLVGNCHVGDSNLYVLRYVLSRMVGKRKAFFALSRGQRRKLMAQVFRFHKVNRRLYSYIARGF